MIRRLVWLERLALNRGLATNYQNKRFVYLTAIGRRIRGDAFFWLKKQLNQLTAIHALRGVFNRRTMAERTKPLL